MKERLTAIVLQCYMLTTQSCWALWPSVCGRPVTRGVIPRKRDGLAQRMIWLSRSNLGANRSLLPTFGPVTDPSAEKNQKECLRHLVLPSYTGQHPKHRSNLQPSAANPRLQDWQRTRIDRLPPERHGLKGTDGAAFHDP